MSNIKKANIKSKLEYNTKEKAEVDNDDEYFDSKIDIPKSSYSNSNDISKINSSFFSSVDCDKNKKNLSNNIEKPKINFENENDSVINGGSSYLKKGSNYSSERYIIDELAKVEKFSAENEK